MSATLERPRTPPQDDPTRGPGRARARGRAWARPGALVGVLVVWVVVGSVLDNKQTLAIGRAEQTGFQTWLTSVKDSFDLHRADNFFLNVVLGGISNALQWVVQLFQDLFSTPPAGRPYPEVGFLGLLAILGLAALAMAGARWALLVVLGTLTFGYFGFYQESVDTIIVTVVTVAICALIGIPLGIAMARSRTVSAVLTPGLDLLQTMPAFAYLAPLTLLFTIGAPAAVAVGVVYAIAPLVRITEHGIRSVAPASLEAAESLGASRRQRLGKVQLPMARRTIVVGLNQCTMAALSMATIAALIAGPGLGAPVIQSLQSLDVGGSFVAGGLIVVIAIMLDRTTTAASTRAERLVRSRRHDPRVRRLVLAAGAVVTLVLVYLSHTKVWAAQVPASPDLAKPTSDAVSSATDHVVNAIEGITYAIKNVLSYGLLNPLQSVMADSPFWLSAAAILLIGLILGGWRAALTTAVCEAVILGVGLWNDSMQTLTTTLVATLLTVLFALVLGVWIGRSRRADAIVRPFLDALQTLPPFVYLVPALALFGPTRFTAIMAAIAYAVPVATKLVADGIRGVEPASVEAAQSAGTTRWQMIGKVQLPMARSALVLAANQGLLYVLSMVVIGALVGGGGLGYLVVAGFSQSQVFGKGLAAGIAITALGVLLDRIARHAAARYGRV